MIVKMSDILEALAVSALLVERLHALHDVRKSIQPPVQLDVGLGLRSLRAAGGVRPQLGEEVGTVWACLERDLQRKDECETQDPCEDRRGRVARLGIHGRKRTAKIPLTTKLWNFFKVTS